MDITSDAGICNMALSHIGVGKEIGTLLTEKSEEARACRRFYDTARRATLRDFPWSFANKLDTLTLVATAPNTEWGYSYRYPSDCVHALRIPSGLRNDSRQSRIPFKVSQDATGQLIYCDTQSAQLEYTLDISDPSRFQPDFVMAFSLRLASYIAPRLTGGDPFKIGDRCAQFYGYEISRAKASISNEGQVDEDPDSEFIRTRS